MCCWNPKIQVRAEYLVSVNKSQLELEVLNLLPDLLGIIWRLVLGSFPLHQGERLLIGKSEGATVWRRTHLCLNVDCEDQESIARQWEATPHSPPPLVVSEALEAGWWGPDRRPLCMLGWGCPARSTGSRTQSLWTQGSSSTPRLNLILTPRCQLCWNWSRPPWSPQSWAPRCTPVPP